jgi:hypothetical protein
MGKHPRSTRDHYHLTLQGKPLRTLPPRKRPKANCAEFYIDKRSGSVDGVAARRLSAVPCNSCKAATSRETCAQNLCGSCCTSFFPGFHSHRNHERAISHSQVLGHGVEYDCYCPCVAALPGFSAASAMMQKHCDLDVDAVDPRTPLQRMLHIYASDCIFGDAAPAGSRLVSLRQFWCRLQSWQPRSSFR